LLLLWKFIEFIEFIEKMSKIIEFIEKLFSKNYFSIFLLVGCDDVIPVHTTGGPSFKIQDIPKRDRLAHQMAEKNSKFYRDKKGKAILKARSNIKTPKTGSMTVRVSTMSPAAIRLATSKLGIRLGTDKALRASYTPSPARRTKKSTPSARSMIRSSVSRRTPASTSSSSVTPKLPSTPADVGDRGVEDPSSLTDNLLNIRASTSKGQSRSKASDFL
jgi:protein DGCR14